MRRIVRQPLAAGTQQSLNTFQQDADAQRTAGTLNVQTHWSGNRHGAAMTAAETVLRGMAGFRERCMYCEDSHGSDIDHFWGKTRHPNRMYAWTNLLLNCMPCGRFKGSIMPVDDVGNTLLVDPTVDDPWQHLDYDPQTGNIVARYNAALGLADPKGSTTCTKLHLAARQPLSDGYMDTYARILRIVDDAIANGVSNNAHFVAELKKIDHPGLLGWCFGGTGQNEPSFAKLNQQQPQAWAACVAAFT